MLFQHILSALQGAAIMGGVSLIALDIEIAIGIALSIINATLLGLRLIAIHSEEQEEKSNEIK